MTTCHFEFHLSLNGRHVKTIFADTMFAAEKRLERIPEWSELNYKVVMYKVTTITEEVEVKV